MKILDFVKKMFQELGFETIEIPFEFDGFNHNFKVFFKEKIAYVVTEIESEMTSALDEFLTSYQSNLFETAISNKEFKEDLKKNSYFLILIENKVVPSYQRKFFINIEEDPYFFKKYVLRYAHDDFKSLIEKTSPTDLVNSLGQLAIDHNVFNKFSEDSKNRVGYENLLYQLYVKVPALSLPTTSKDIGDLSKDIHHNLNDELREKNEKLLVFLEKVDEKVIDLKMFKQIIGQL